MWFDAAMRLLDRLERRFPRLGIPGLGNHLVALNALFYFLIWAPGGETAERHWRLLCLDRERVLAGEIWRLFTHLLIPPPMMPIWLLFFLWLMWLIARGLEQAWGSFRFTVFYGTGALLTTIAAMLIPAQQASTATYLNLSLFFAFATVFPDFQLLLMLVIPVKVKWLAWFSAFMQGLAFIESGWAVRGFILVSLANYGLFFGRDVASALYHRQRRERYRKKVQASTQEAFHRCVVCGLTERDDNTLEFRVCTDCAGGAEYCTEHLAGHTHREAEAG